MCSSKGFTLIEVLIAFIILMISISVATAAYKEYRIVVQKQKKAERMFIAAISLMNKLKSMKVNLRMNEQEGKFNGLSYKIKVKRIAAKRNYIYFFNKRGNKGNFLITLYKITLTVGNKNFILYKTQFQRLH